MAALSSLSRRVFSAMWLVGLLAIALAIGTLGGSPGASAAPAGVSSAGLAAEDEAAEGAETDPVRPDAISAIVTAQASGERVEDLSQRTESAQVFANPDGTWTQETASGPEWVQDEADGSWDPIDTTLVERDGVLEPTTVPTDLQLSAGGDRVFAEMSKSGHDMEWRWSGDLPEPVVDGSTATYPDAVDGGDLVVTATPTGFTHSIVLHEAPSEPLEVTIPIAADGGDLTEDAASGELAVTNPAGTKTLATAPAPVMWDASEADDDGGLGDSSEPVEVEVGETASGNPTLTLQPDEDFLSDPETVYPVTIDPSFTLYTSGDTWLSNVTTSSQHSDDELRVGTKDGGDTKSRAFVRFNNLFSSLPANARATSASLILRNFSSVSCSGSAIRVNRITTDWGLSTIDWNHQPGITADSAADYSPNKGYDSSCPAGDATWDITGIVNDWRAGEDDNEPTITNNGIQIKAVDESVNKSWRKYRSADLGDPNSSLRPKVSVTYDRWPNDATRVGVTPASMYTPAGASEALAYTSTTTPTLKAVSTDPDGGGVYMYFEVRTSQSKNATLNQKCETSTAVASGATATCQLSTALTSNSTYAWRAKPYQILNGTKSWPGDSLEADEGWSAWGWVRTATVTPAAPQISCGSSYTNGNWYPTPPSSDLTCTISAAGTASSYSSPAYIRWTKDGSTETRTAIPQSSDPTVAKTTITLPKAAGSHTITARAESPSGVISVASEFKVSYGTVPSSNCEWGIADMGSQVRLTNSSGTGVLTQTSGDDASPVFEGEFGGTPITVTLWRSTSQAQDEANIADLESNLDDLALDSVDQATDEPDGVDAPDQEDEIFSSTEPLEGDSEAVAYRVERSSSVEYGTRVSPAPSDRSPLDCVAPLGPTGNGSTGTQLNGIAEPDEQSDREVVLPTESGRFIIGSGDPTDSIGSVDSPSTLPEGPSGSHKTSVFVMRTFIPEYSVNTGDGIPGGGCGEFRGDNRGFTSKSTASSSRTAVSVTFDWTANRLTTSKSVGTTHKVHSGGRIESKTASAAGIKFEYGFVKGHSHGGIYIYHAVGNPLCTVGAGPLQVNVAGPIRYIVGVSAWKNGAISITGRRSRVPNFESYWFPNPAAIYGETLLRATHGAFSCLTAPCSLVKIDSDL